MGDFELTYTDKKVNEFRKKQKVEESNIGRTKLENVLDMCVSGTNNEIAKMDAYDSIYDSGRWSSEYKEFSKDEIRDVARLTQMADKDASINNINAEDAMKNPMFYDEKGKERGYFNRKKLKKAAKAYTKAVDRKMENLSNEYMQNREGLSVAKDEVLKKVAIKKREIVYNLNNKENLDNYKAEDFKGGGAINDYFRQLEFAQKNPSEETSLFETPPLQEEIDAIKELDDIKKLPNVKEVSDIDRRRVFIKRNLNTIFSYRLTHNGTLPKSLTSPKA